MSALQLNKNNSNNSSNNPTYFNINKPKKLKFLKDMASHFKNIDFTDPYFLKKENKKFLRLNEKNLDFKISDDNHKDDIN